MAVKRGKKEEVRERRYKALELRKAGASYKAIGEALGVSHAQAHKDVMTILAEIEKLGADDAKALREITLQRLDTALLSIWNPVKQGNLGAIDRYLRIEERRAKLLGLDAPTKQDVTSLGEKITIAYTGNVNPDEL